MTAEECAELHGKVILEAVRKLSASLPPALLVQTALALQAELETAMQPPIAQQVASTALALGGIARTVHEAMLQRQQVELQEALGRAQQTLDRPRA